MDRWKVVESFVTVAKMKSFSRAADQLGVSRSLISKRIDALERMLGAQLISRVGSNMRLTEAGVHYFEVCQRSISDFARIEAEITQLQKEPLGSLTVVAPLSFGSLHLAKAIAEYSSRHPQITISFKLDTDVRSSFDSSRQEFDISIRLVQPPDDAAFLSRRLGSLRWVICASKEYLRRMGTPKDPSALREHNCLTHLRLTPDRVWRFVGDSVKVGGTFRSNSDLAIREAAIAGVGIAQLPTYYVGSDLKDGSLIPILTSYSLAERPVYALISAQRHMPRKVKSLIDFLGRWFREAAWDKDAA